MSSTIYCYYGANPSGAGNHSCQVHIVGSFIMIDDSWTPEQHRRAGYERYIPLTEMIKRLNNNPVFATTVNSQNDQIGPALRELGFMESPKFDANTGSRTICWMRPGRKGEEIAKERKEKGQKSLKSRLKKKVSKVRVW